MQWLLFQLFLSKESTKSPTESQKTKSESSSAGKQKDSKDTLEEISEGYLDMAVLLRYKSAQSIVFIIEVKLAKIATCDPADIDAAHATNLENGKKQVELYIWKEPKVAKEQRVVVSGVWHHSDEQENTFEMSTKCLFLKLTVVDSSDSN